MSIRKSIGILSIFVFILYFSGCQKENNKIKDDDKVYETLVQRNENYGLKKEDTCKSIFKCDISKISETVILAPTWEPEIFKNHVSSINKISGPTGHGFTLYELTQNNQSVTYITIGIGACNLIDAVLALGQTNCKEIIFIGANGSLDETIKIGDIMIPEYSICGVGADRYLCIDNLKNNDCFGKKYYPDSKLLDQIKNITNQEIENTDIKSYPAYNYSCDTIYAEYAHLEEIINMGCNSIEMETATLFHTANIVGIKSVAIFGVSDNTLAKKSLYSDRTSDDSERRTNVKNNIIPKIVLQLSSIT